MIKPIITDKRVLRQKSYRSLINNPDLAIVVQDLKDTAASLTNCAGLAAPQIGHKLCVVLVFVQGVTTIMVNPEYVERKGKQVSGREGCFSIPDTLTNPVMVRRYNKIVVQYEDERGFLQRRRFKSFEARLVQHEFDHLVGVIL